jgi:aerobic carbon-monoxide dehydrogenase large subunit
MQRFGIGQPVRRVEDQRFLTGHGRYVGDINLPRQCYGVPVLSIHAHARIRQINVERASAAPGVVCVLTGADALADKLGGTPPNFMPENLGGPKGYRTFRPLLVTDKVRCVGDRVAYVVAETEEQARDAASLVDIDYVSLPTVVSPEDAIRPGAAKVYDDCEGNKCCEMSFGDLAATDAAFAGAKHIVRLRLESNRVSANAIEPRVAIGDFDIASGTYTLYSSNQNPHGMRQTLAGAVFHIPETMLRVVAPDVGGGFGMKADAYPDDALVLWASKRTGRPVKWVATRAESLLGDTHGRDQVAQGEMALDANGKILAIRAHSMHSFGAYVVSAAVQPTLMALRFIPSVYTVKAFYGNSQGIFTNTPPTSVYRGAGRPEAVYLTERLLDRAAAELGIDPVEIRRRNLIPASAMPWSTPTGFQYDSGDFAMLLERCQMLGDWQGFAKRREASARAGKLRGRAMSFFIEMGGVFNERMELRFDPGAGVSIVAGTHSHGQGHATVFAQLVAEWLGIPFESIRYVQGDTDQVAFGRGTYAARSSLVGGCALRFAADDVIAKARAMAAHLMEAPETDIEFKAGRFNIVGTDRSMSFTDVAKAFFMPFHLPTKFTLGLSGAGSFAAEPPNFPNGCHSCEVEVDPETGEVRLERYAAVDDVGRALNPLICEGQVQGGLAQGIGQAMHEHVVFDGESGQLLAGSFLDYTMPRADDLPDFDLALAEVPSTTNPLGIKGVGEAGAIGAPPTIINALLDALRPLGVKDFSMPATPLRVWQAIQAARA